MKITFIGTSSGKASLTRFYSSLLISSDKYNLLVDAGDGISRALINSGINFNSLNGILLTHLHPDHFSGLPSLIIQMKMMKRNEPLDIFIHESLKAAVEESLLRTYILPDKIEFEIRYKTFIDNNSFKITEKLSFLPRRNSHLDKLEKFKGRFPSLSLYSASVLFQEGNKKIFYTSDISSEEDLLLFREVVPDVFIVETTHMSPAAIMQSVIKINPGKVYLTHYSDEDIPKINEILASLSNIWRGKVSLAEDGIFFEI